MQAISSPVHGSRVLLVDDDPVLLEALSTMIGLRLPHVSVVPCGSSRASLELFRTVDCELIISDLRMPQVDGLALLAQVRALRPAIPFILMSGHMDGRRALEALRLGPYSVIDNPIDRTAFIAWVKRALLSREVSGAVSQERLEMAHLRHMTQPLDPPGQNLQLLSQPLAHLTSTENRYTLPMVFDRVAADLGLEVYFNYSLCEEGDELHLEWYRGVSGQTAKDCEYLALREAVCGTVAASGQPNAEYYRERSAPRRSEDYSYPHLGHSAVCLFPVLPRHLFAGDPVFWLTSSGEIPGEGSRHVTKGREPECVLNLDEY